MKVKATKSIMRVFACLVAAFVVIAVSLSCFSQTLVLADDTYTITVTNGTAYDSIGGNEITSAKAGDTVYVRFNYTATPEGKYVKLQYCLVNGTEDSDLGATSGSDYSAFTMPSENVEVSPVYLDSEPLVIDLRAGNVTSNVSNARALLDLAVFEGSISSRNAGSNHYYDLDLDGNYDISIVDSDRWISILSTNSIQGFISFNPHRLVGSELTRFTTLDFYFPGTTYSVKPVISTYDADGNFDDNAIGGTATVSKDSGLSGETVTVTATPSDGYQLKSISWGDGAASNDDITSTKQFVIEDYDVIVDVVFEEIASSTSGSTTTDPATGTSTGTTTDPATTSTSSGSTTDPATSGSTTSDPGTSTSSGTTTDPATSTSSGTTTDPATSTSSGTTTDPATSTSSGTTTDPATGTTTDTATGTTSGTSGNSSGATMDPSAPTYKVIQGGDGTADGTKDYVLEIERSEDDVHCLDYYDWVAVDGIKLTDEQAPASSGSTIITIKAEYLKTLSEGKHTIVVNFVDNSVSTTLTIQSAAQKSGTAVPATGELLSPALYIGMALIAIACGVTGVVLVKKRKEV